MEIKTHKRTLACFGMDLKRANDADCIEKIPVTVNVFAIEHADESTGELVVSDYEVVRDDSGREVELSDDEYQEMVRLFTEPYDPYEYGQE